MKRQATTPLAEPSTKKINPGPLEINTKGTKKYHEGTARYPIRKALLQKKMGDMLTQIRAAEQGFEELLAATSGSYQRNREEIEAHKKSIRAAYDALPDAERTPERQKKFKEDLDAARYWRTCFLLPSALLSLSLFLSLFPHTMQNRPRPRRFTSSATSTARSSREPACSGDSARLR